MSTFYRISAGTSGGELERVVEPLASYICAMEQPKTALLSAVAVLLREVEATNRAAATLFKSIR